MKRFQNFLMAVAVAALAVVSCTKEEVAPETNVQEDKVYEYLFTLGEADITKATLADGKVVTWQKGDYLGVVCEYFDGGYSYSNSNTKSEITPSSGETPAKFLVKSYKALTTGGKVFCFFPYIDKQFTDPKITMSIPASQNNTINEMPMASIPFKVTSDVPAQTGTEVGDIKMLMLGSIARFKIFSTNADYQGEKIKSVEFKTASTDVAGSFDINIDNIVPSTASTLAITLSDNKSTSITESVSDMTVTDNKENGIVDMVIAPGTYSGTLTIVTDAATYEFTLTDKEFKRAHVKPFSVDLASSNCTRTVPVDYVTLPFEWAGGSSADFANIDGVTLSGNGSDYKDSNAPYLIKFDGTDDYFTIKTDSPVDVLSIGVKMIGGNSTSYLTVYGSTDGEEYAQVEKLTISGNTNDEKTLTTTESFNSSYRYIKVVYTKGSNIGIGPVSITKGVPTCMTPTLATGSEPAGAVLIGTVIKLDCATEGVTIYYTTDGTKPSTSSSVYTDEGIAITEACTIKAYAVKTDFVDSDVLSLSYTIKVVETPEISISDDGKATITCEEGATIYYTLNVEDPTDKSEEYTKPVQMEDNQTIKAIAYKSNMTKSAVASAKYESGQYTITFDTEIENGSISVNGDKSGSVKVMKGETVTIVATPDDYCEFVSWTITPDVSFASGSAIDATATFTMPENAVTISATFEKEQASAPVVLYDFSKIDGFSSWDSGYNKHVVEYEDATVTFSAACKQTGTITDVPVTKGSEIIVVMKNNTVINSLDFLTKQWSDKANDVTLCTSKDGGTTFTATSSTAGAGAILSASNLNGVNAIKFTFSSQDNQIGIAALALNGADLPKEDATPSFNPTSISVEVGKTKDFTYTTEYDGTLNIQSNNPDVATISIAGNKITVTGVSEGNTTISFKGNATAQYYAIDESIPVEVVAAGQGGGSYEIVFKDSGSASDGSSAKTAITDLIKDGGGYISSISASNVYQGKKDNGAKFGSGSKKGSLTLNWNTTDYAVKPTKITFSIAMYDSGQKVKISYNSATATSISPTTSFADYSITMDGNTALTSIKVEATNASNNRFYLRSIIVEY